MDFTYTYNYIFEHKEDQQKFEKYKEQCKDKFGWYKKISKDLTLNKISLVQRHGLYNIIYINNGDMDYIINLKYRRFKFIKKFGIYKLLKMVEDGELNYNIWHNYITNGYNTRAGLFRSKTDLKRLQTIAKSHADYIGSETGNSTTDHINRVNIRNNFY